MQALYTFIVSFVSKGSCLPSFVGSRAKSDCYWNGKEPCLPRFPLLGAGFLAFTVAALVLEVGLSVFAAAVLVRSGTFCVFRLDDRAEPGGGIRSSASSASGISSWGSLQGPLAYC